MNRIKELRERLNLTLEALSEKTKTEAGDGQGLSIGYLSHLENGSRDNPSKDTMERVSKALDRTVSEVFFPDH